MLRHPSLVFSSMSGRAAAFPGQALHLHACAAAAMLMHLPSSGSGTRVSTILSGMATVFHEQPVPRQGTCSWSGAII